MYYLRESNNSKSWFLNAHVRYITRKLENIPQLWFRDFEQKIAEKENQKFVLY